MNPSKKCPNCQSRKIAGPHQDAGTIVVSRPTGFAETESYVCVECGFVQKFVKEKAIKVLKKKGKFTLNPPNPEVTRCPECDTKFKENSYQCRKCGFERDFDYSGLVEEF